MPNLSWRDAVIEILSNSPEAMHYADIAEAIADQGLRTDFGATPATSVNVTISYSLQNDGTNSPFIRVDRGRYWLRDLAQNQVQPAAAPNQPQASEPDETGLINAFGMYWARNNVLWANTPRILGQQQPGSTAVDFCNQKGVYLLHDGRAVVYVGRTTEQPLGIRLRQHISDRLNGRWDRFSWFGVYSVADNASLNTTATVSYDLSMLIVTMEALLIEGLEPPQNRKRGDDFRAVEFLQVEDPEIQKTQIVKLMDELKKKL
ncbi:HTH domain-containing protein [Accumulibacter sp.]|uniref:HTH domain-containing protein n=1 Tax=Accumulibacter sp. TaxID=2053492 RepID=UPI002618AEDD|nr:HTH domain-containing protein [Accumulibacter sp.]